MTRVMRVLGGEKLAIAAGGTGTINLKNDLDLPLIVERWRFVPRLNAVKDASVAGTPLPLDSDPADSSNDMPPAALVNVQIKVGDESWFNAPRSVACLDDRAGGFFITQPIIPPKHNVVITIENNTAVAIDFEAAFAGYVDKAS